MIEIVASIFIVLTLVLGFGMFILIKKLERYMDVLEFYDQGLVKVRETILQNVEYVAKLDVEGHFQSDDELGVFFEAMKAAVEVIGNTVLGIKDAEEEER